MTPRDSDQLELSLGDGVSGAEAAALPWGGVSPRTLTRIHKVLFLRRKPEKSVSEFVDPNQLEFWPADEKAPPFYGGAPLLLGIPRR